MNSYLTESQLKFFKPYFNVHMINAAIEALDLGTRMYYFQRFKFDERLKYTFVEVSEEMKKTHKLIDEFFELPDQSPEAFETFAEKTIPPITKMWECSRIGHVEAYEDTYLHICIEYFKRIGYVYHVQSEMIRRNTILVYMFNKKQDELHRMAWKLHRFNNIYGDPNAFNATPIPIDNIDLLRENFKFFFPLAPGYAFDTAEGILEDLEKRNLLDVVFKKTGTNVQANAKERLTFENGVIVKKTVSASITREIYE